MSTPPATPDPAAADLYARLGVARDATPDAVRAAYREAVRRHPPERDAEAFKRVREAFETLDDPAERERYDLLDDDSPAALFARAERAMGDRDYAAASTLFKRVLLEDAAAVRARNLLGLCLMYLGQPAAAVAQYERLLAGPDPATVWLLNAGHAYREAGRLDDARRVLRLAAARDDADAADVGVARADVEVDARDYRAAHEAIREGLVRHPPRTPGAVLLLLRRLDVFLLAGDEAAYRATLGRVERAAADAGWQAQGAYRLGIVAWRLIDSSAFTLARPAAEAARRLQPDDLDYDALAELATALGEFAVGRARWLTRVHVAFGPGKWLQPLGPRVAAYCDEHAAFEGLQRLHRAPSLALAFGCGGWLVGRRDRDGRTGTYVSTYYLALFFLPVVPLSRYRVRDGKGRARDFVGRLPLSRGERLHLTAALVLLALGLGWGVATGAAGGVANVHAVSTGLAVAVSVLAARVLRSGGRHARPAQLSRGRTSEAREDRT